MARIALWQLLDHAAEHDFGVPAFDFNNMEQGLAIMEAAAATDAPVCWLARVFDLDPADSGRTK